MKPVELMTVEEWVAYQEVVPSHEYGFVAACDSGLGGALHGFGAAAWWAIKEGRPVSIDAQFDLDNQIDEIKAHIQNMIDWERTCDARGDREPRIELNREEFEKLTETYFADKPKGPRKVYTHAGKLWAIMSWETGCERSLARAFSLVPASEYKGQTFTQEELHALWDKGEGERGNDVGLRVTFRGKPFVLATQQYFVCKKGETAPAPAKVEQQSEFSFA
jgi:hypothetical protein